MKMLTNCQDINDKALYGRGLVAQFHPIQPTWKPDQQPIELQDNLARATPSSNASTGDTDKEPNANTRTVSVYAASARPCVKY